MSGAEIRERAASGPSETDIAFAKAVKSRRVGPDADAPPPVPAGSEGGELALLRQQVEDLRRLIAGKAPTAARRTGEVADAEMSAEAASIELAEFLDEAKPRAKEDPHSRGEWIYPPADREKIATLRDKVKDLNQKVDIARFAAGMIPRNHPGLKFLPPDHPVFRGR